MEENTLYQITGFQTVYANSVRDNVKLIGPVFTEDIEDYRRKVIKRYGCMSVNLTYIEIDKDKLKNLI